LLRLLTAPPLTTAHIILPALAMDVMRLGLLLFPLRAEAKVASFFASRAAAFFARAKDSLATALFAEILPRAGFEFFPLRFFTAALPIMPRLANATGWTTTGADGLRRR
jgi:hypothetical protein